MNHNLAQLEAEAIAVVHKLGLPPCPQVLVDIRRELRRETPDVQKIANLVTHDVTSSAAILKTVNSAYYGLSNKARSVQQAIAYLGLNHTSYLLAGLLLRNAFPGLSKPAMARFWDTSTQLALTAAYLARKLGAIDRDEAHTFGLFRDVGVAVLICKFNDYENVTERGFGGPTSRITTLEKERFGTDHAVIGAVFARDWQLPEEMTDAILWHHADFVFNLEERPISDDALKLVALGMLCDRILDEYEGARFNEQTARLSAEALGVFSLSESKFADLQAEAMTMLDEIALAPAPTIRIKGVAR